MSLLGIIFGAGTNSIGGIVIDATVRESHDGTADITENPVEEGAKITDHVQVNSDELTIEGVITDTPLGFPVIGNIQNIINSVTSIFGKTSRSIDAFNQLVTLKEQREPFTVYTGLKRYESMVIASLSVQRDKDVGKAIAFNCVMRKIRIVSSQTGVSSNLSSGKKINSIAGLDVGKETRTDVSSLGQSTQNLGNRVTKTVSPTGSKSAAAQLFDTFKF